MSKYKIFGSTTQELKLPQDKPQYNLDLINSQSIPPEYTFTRNSAGTYVGADGLIKTAAANEPRFDYDPITGEFRGLLIEESRTNKINYSSNFAGGWGTINVVKTADVTLSPDGITLADEIYATSNAVNTGYTSKGITSFTQNVWHTFSMFWKAGTSYGVNVQFVWLDPNNAGVVCAFRLSNGELVNSGLGGYGNYESGGYTIEKYPNDWWKVSVTFRATGVPSNSISSVWLYPSYNSSGTRVTDLTSYFWGAQVEVGSFPTSYIPTSGSTVTRQPDQLVLNKPFNSLGTFFVESTPTTGVTVSADNGTSSLVMSSTGKEALYYNTNRTLRMPSDSIPTSFNISTPQNLNRVSLGFNRLNNSTYINGYLKKFMYYGSPVTEDNLRSLTGNVLDTYKDDGTIVTNGLVLNLDAAYYTGGTAWTDLSGNGNNGTLVNGVGYDSSNGGSLSFDGTNDHILGTIPSSTFSGPHSICCWFYRETVTQWSALFSNNVNTTSCSIFTFIETSNSLGTNQVGLDAASISVDLGVDHLNKWIYAVITYAGTTSGSGVNVYAYKNGSLLTSTGSLYWNLSTSSSYYVGRHWTTDIQIHDGFIPQVSIYNRALTPQEIQQNFNALRGRFGI